MHLYINKVSFVVIGSESAIVAIVAQAAKHSKYGKLNLCSADKSEANSINVILKLTR